MTKRPLAAIVLVSSCAVLVAGCGSSSSRLSADDYRARLTSLGKEADQAQAALDRALSAKTVAEIGTGVAGFADDEDRLGDTVAKLKPPKDAESANAKLARGLHDLASEIRAVLPDLGKQPTVKAAVGFLEKNLGSATGAREVDGALAELRKLGYTTEG